MSGGGALARLSLLCPSPRKQREVLETTVGQAL